jgi:hypothetical protein
VIEGAGEGTGYVLTLVRRSFGELKGQEFLSRLLNSSRKKEQPDNFM